MTYNVFGRTTNLTQSINHSRLSLVCVISSSGVMFFPQNVAVPRLSKYATTYS